MLTANFSVGDFIELETLTVKDQNGNDRMLRLGRYPKIISLSPNGLPIESNDINYCDAYGVIYNNAEYQLHIQMQFLANLRCANITENPENYIGYSSFDIVKVAELTKYYEQAFIRTESNNQQYQFCGINPKKDWGFLDFTPLNNVEYYDGMYPFESLGFTDIPNPYYIINSERQLFSLYQGYRNRNDVTWNFTLYNDNADYTSINKNHTNIIPKIRQPFDIWICDESRGIGCRRYFVDIVPIERS